MATNITYGEISILLLQEDNGWVAQCLEKDIAAQGNSINEALASFKNTFIGQLILDYEDNKTPLEDLQEAPKEYWDKYQLSRPLRDKESFALPHSGTPSPICETTADLRVVA